MTDEKLMKVLDCCANDDCGNCPTQVKRCRQHAMLNALDLIKRQKAEIDRFADIGKMYSEVRAESIKEFAERLKETKFKHGSDYFVYAENIDNLVKEMTEDAKHD